MATSASDAMANRKESVWHAISVLDSHQALLTSCISHWKDLERHFADLEDALQKRSKEVAEREKAFEIRIGEAIAALDKRESSIASREESSLARVLQQKDAAIAAIAEEKRKALEEQQKKEEVESASECAKEGKKAVKADAEAGKEARSEKDDREFARDDRKTAASDLKTELDGRETVTGARKRGRRAERKGRLTTAQEGRKIAEDGRNTTKKADQEGCNSLKDEQKIMKDYEKTKKEHRFPVNEGTKSVKCGASTSLEEAINQAKAAYEAQVAPTLRSYCEMMDAGGLRKFIVHRRKDIHELRAELPAALQASSDPCRLVLKALEWFHDLKLNSESVKDCAARGQRRTCILLLRSLSQLIADPVLGEDYPIVPSDVKELAKAMAQQWHSKLWDFKITDDYSLNVHGFLQLLATFGIASEYDDDELLDYVISICRRSKTPELCRALGLTGRIPGLVDRLLREGKPLEALSFAKTFGFIEKLQPGLILKSYLEDARNSAQLLVKKAPTELSGQNDACARELAALNLMLKFMKEYDLGLYYPIENVNKRVADIEQEKQERKALADALRKQAKKPRLSGGPGGSVSKGNTGVDSGVGYNASSLGKPTSVSALDRGYYVPTDLGVHSGSLLSSYGLTSQTGYEIRPDATYGSAYSRGNISQVPLTSPSGFLSRDTAGSSLLGSVSLYPNTAGSSLTGPAPSYPIVPSPYSGYQFGTALPPTSSGYRYPS